jgi:hypothetical protein
LSCLYTALQSLPSSFLSVHFTFLPSARGGKNFAKNRQITDVLAPCCSATFTFVRSAFLRGRKPALVAAAPAAAPAAGPGSSRIAAPADRSTASVVLAAGGGTARLHAGAVGCTARSLAGAEAEAIGAELLGRPRGREISARQSADVCLSHSLKSKMLQKKYKKQKKTENRTQSYDILGKVRGTKDQPTDQRTNDYRFGPVSFRR